MTNKKYSELKFEEWIEQSLLKNGYHRSFVHSNEFSHLYDRELCLIGEEVLGFIKSTQQEEYEKLHTSIDDLTDSHILKTIDKSIKERGIIYTLRNGINTRGCGFQLVYFQPKSNLNINHQELYSKKQRAILLEIFLLLCFFPLSLVQFTPFNTIFSPFKSVLN